MTENASLAIAAQAFDHLLSLCEPEKVYEWKPQPAQRAEYLQFAELVLDSYWAITGKATRRLRLEGATQTVVPTSHLRFLREVLEPRIPTIRDAADYLDPDGKLLRDFSIVINLGGPGGFNKRIRRTFDEGVQQIYELLERNPDLVDDSPLHPDLADEVLNSKLIQFDPDAWWQRSSSLAPIRSDRANFQLPIHVRLRLEELYRAHVFGLWLSVLALARSILEYAILDNAPRLQIDIRRPPGLDGKQREKKLVELIEDVAGILPTQRIPMERIRDLGNEYLHPRKSRQSKEMMLQREEAAREAVRLIVGVVESIYLTRT